MTTKSMDLIETPFKTGSARDIKNKVSDNVLYKISTSRIVWHLVKRHKFAIVATWAIIVTVDSVFPPIWDILGSIARLK